MTKTEELKERIKKLPVKYPKGTSKITLEKDWIFELGQKVILKEWLEREQEIMKIIEGYTNPYPKDVFPWDNKEKLDFNRGRFNQHCFEIVENIKKGLREEIENGKDFIK